MEIFVFRGVKGHEVLSVLQAFQETTGPRTIEVESDAEIVDRDGQDARCRPALPEAPRNAEESAGRTGGGGAKPPNGDGGSGRPVNVHVSVVATAASRARTAKGGGKKKGQKAEARGQRSEDGGQKAEDGGRREGEAEGAGVSGREHVKKVAAGRDRAVIKDRGDRKAIRSEVNRLAAMGLSQAEACEQVAKQAQAGRAGEHRLTMKYNDEPGHKATARVVRRISLADW